MDAKFNEVKPELKAGKRVCQCADCGLFFGSVSSFDDHLKRKGTADVDCRTQDEMIRAGMRPNSYGVWLGTKKELKAQDDEAA